MKKIFIFIFCFLSFFIFLTHKINAQTETVSGEQIRNFDTKIIINKDGTINVQETIVYDFDSLSKHGIYRETPYKKTNQDNKQYILKFDNFSVTDENGGNYNFVQSESGNNISLKIGDANKLITGLHTYIISYKVLGALTYFSDHDELYWNITGNDWTVPIVSATSEVTIPGSTNQNQVKTICYTGSLGSKEQNCSSNANQNLVTVKNNNILYSNQGLTLVISFPKNLVAVLEPKEYIPFSQTLLGKLLVLLAVLAALTWYIFLPLFIPIRWYLAGRDPKLVGTGEVSAWYDPPKTKDGRFLTPGETGTLIDEKADIREVTAMIIDLARRGYLKIIEKTKGEFSLVKGKEKNKNFMAFESKFLTDIFNEGDEFLLKNNQMYEISESVKNSYYNQLVLDGSFPKNPKTVRTLYSVLAVIALFTGNIVLAIITFIFAGIMPRKTLLGAQQSAVAKSLKNFLSSQERQLNFQAKEQYFFEKLLPYAIAFGVERVWVNRFKDMDLAQPDWYKGYYGSNFTTALFILSLNSSFSKMSSSAMTSTRSSSGFSSGFSSGGGFSGGGGGGGGGGSW